VGGRPGRTYHVMCAAADVTYIRLSLASPRIHKAVIARALFMMASITEKATWCRRSFCLLKSSYENIVVSVGTSAASIMWQILPGLSRAFCTASDSSLAVRHWVLGHQLSVGGLTLLFWRINQVGQRNLLMFVPFLSQGLCTNEAENTVKLPLHSTGGCSPFTN